MLRTRRSAVLASLSIAFMGLRAVVPASAQGTTDPSMEKIVAVVGKEIVLKSDIDGQIEMYAQQFPAANRSDPKLRESIITQMVNDRLIISKAFEDSVEVSDAEATARIEQQIAMLAGKYGSEKRVEELYGMSIQRIKTEYLPEVRKQMMMEEMRRRKFGSIKATRGEVESFYNKYKDSIPNVPPRVELFHLVKYVKANETQRKEAQDLALRVRDSIIKGGSFGDYARTYSSDPGSAANGGDLGFSEFGKFVPAFETAAKALHPNEISQPIETPFGFHVIQLIEQTSTGINARHILFRVGQTEADREVTRTALLALKAKVAAGESFEDLAKTQSEEKATAGFNGSMGQIELTAMPEELRTTIAALPDGGVTDPLPYTADPTNPGYHILFRKRVVAEHKPTLESDYKMIEQMAIMEKKQRMEQEWVAELRNTLYWEMR